VRGEWGARRVVIVMLDPHTGAIVAQHDDRIATRALATAP